MESEHEDPYEEGPRRVKFNKDALGLGITRIDRQCLRPRAGFLNLNLTETDEESLLTVKPEYDFSEAKRGKFFTPDAELRLPIYLDADVQHDLPERERIAADNGETVNNVLNRKTQIID